MNHFELTTIHPKAQGPRPKAHKKNAMKHLSTPSKLALAITATIFGLCAASGCSSQLTQGAISKGDADALQAFPFGIFDELTQKYVDDMGRADYTALQKDRAGLDQYVSTTAVVGPSTYPKLFPDTDHELAYYINGYNALAMFNVLSRYPDIKDLDSGFKQLDFFVSTILKIDGKDINLKDLENEVVRPIARKAYQAQGKCTKLGRVHFALNCASGGCPKLPAEAFLPEKLEEQLERETRKFVREPRNVSVNDNKRTVTISNIFEWYAEDFTDDSCKTINQLAWINMFLDEDKQIDTSYKIEIRPYDWTLNDQKLFKK